MLDWGSYSLSRALYASDQFLQRRAVFSQNILERQQLAVVALDDARTDLKENNRSPQVSLRFYGSGKSDLEINFYTCFFIGQLVLGNKLLW